MKLTRPYIMAAALTVALLGAATAGVVAHAGGTTKTINVTEKEYKIGLSTRKTTAGSVRFVIRNTGRLTHRFAIAGPGLKMRKSPMIPPGKTVRMTVTVKAGKYSIWCPIPGHAALGMKATLTVPGSSTGSGSGYGGAATTTTPTTTSSSGGGAWG
jgi:uncharacterized cupredoxin-like copper-binding protein